MLLIALQIIHMSMCQPDQSWESCGVWMAARTWQMHHFWMCRAVDPDVNGEFASPMPQPDTVLAESSTQQLAQLTLSAVPIPARQEAQAGSGKGSVLEPAIGSAAESSCCTSPAGPLLLLFAQDAEMCCHLPESRW